MIPNCTIFGITNGTIILGLPMDPLWMIIEWKNDSTIGNPKLIIHNWDDFGMTSGTFDNGNLPLPGNLPLSKYSFGAA